MDVIGTLGRVFPGTMLRYLQRRRLFEMARAYEAAKASGYRRLVTNQTSGDGVMDQAGDSLRQLARHLEENHDLTVAIFDDLVNNSVGGGIRVAPMVMTKDGQLAEKVNDRLADLHEEWCEAPETRGELGWHQVERLSARSLFRDGEIFIQAVQDRGGYRYPRHGIRLALELIEADLVPMDYQDRDKGILHGIQIDEWGKALNYYAYKWHPGDPLRGAHLHTDDLKRMPAQDILHLKFSRRVGQRRGVTILHAVINRLRDIQDYEDSERIAAKVAADFTWYIKKSAEMSVGNPAGTTGTERNLVMQSGMGFELNPGEDVGLIKSDRPNTKLVEYREAMLRAVAGGTGTRFSSIARNYNGTYSAQRQELVEGAIAYRAHTSYLISRLHRPVWNRFVQEAVRSMRLDKLLRDVNPDTLYRADFRHPALPWIDPAKEANAYQILVEAGLESRQEIMRARGRDPGKVWDELEEEKASGLFDSQVAKAAVPSPGDPPDDDEADELEDAA